LEWDLYLLADHANQLGEVRKLTCSEQERQTISESEKLYAQSALIHLANVVRTYPDSARAHSRLAGALINRFEQSRLESDNAMTIGQIREAAQASQFENPTQLQHWLHSAFGNDSRLLYLAHHHARRSLALCPLQGEAYLYLADLCFLEGRGAPATNMYYRQAMLVGPHDPQVMFTVGKHHLAAGSIDKALPLWSKAFRNAGKHRRLIINVLAGNMTAAHFLNAFQPDWSSLKLVWDGFQLSGTPEDLRDIQRYASQQAIQEAPVLTNNKCCLMFLEISRMQLALDDPQASLESLQRAHALCPDDFSVRYELGKVQLVLGAPELAERHLRWCVNQRPDSEIVRSYLMKASRARMQRLARATTTSSN
jgi:tetratricopeptide (TPR) repeat protein